MNNVHYRPTGHNKAPTYSSEKRAKFAHRENKKWIRFALVIGYIISVSTPAIVLSLFYTFFWNPDYHKLIHKGTTDAALPHVSTMTVPALPTPSPPASDSSAVSRDRQPRALGAPASSCSCECAAGRQPADGAGKQTTTGGERGAAPGRAAGKILVSLLNGSFQRQRQKGKPPLNPEATNQVSDVQYNGDQ